MDSLGTSSRHTSMKGSSSLVKSTLNSLKTDLLSGESN